MAKSKPIKIFTLDTETYNGLAGGIKRIAVYDGQSITYGFKFSDIEPYLIEQAKKFRIHIYIHNMEFDARKMPELFNEKKVIWDKSFILNGKVATIATKHYIMHDSFRLLPMSLKKLSEGFNITHSKLDLWTEVEKAYPKRYKDIVDFLDRCDVNDELYLRYLGYDVISLYEILQKLIEISGIPLKDFVKRVSTASLSRYLFKKGWKDKKFMTLQGDSLVSDFDTLCSYNYTNDSDAEEFLRGSYCGGRVEVFKMILDKKGYHYDINSLYPYCMLQELPVGKPLHYYNKDIAKEYFNNWCNDKKGYGFLSCLVNIPFQSIPPLPVKMGKLTFPTGIIYGTWTFEELDFAVNNCGVKILDYYEVIFYRRTFPVFRKFVETFYKLKEEAAESHNEALRTFAKLILNCGYGYTGMRRDDKTQLKDYSMLEQFEHIVYANERMGYIEVPSEIKAAYIQVQIASAITSKARLRLLKALKAAEKIGQVYYCDTDSIVLDKPLPDIFIDDFEIGKFKLESQPERGIFLKPKVYAELFETGTNIKFKGVSRETQQSMNISDYEYLLKELTNMNNDFVIVEKNRLTFRSIMYTQKKGIDVNTFEIRDKKFNIKTVEKRKMFYKDNYTEPLYFPTEQDFEDFSYKDFKPYVQFDMLKKGGNSI